LQLGVCAFTPLSSQATARPDGRHLVRKPSRDSDRQTAREPCRQDLSTVRTSRTLVVDTQSDGSVDIAGRQCIVERRPQIVRVETANPIPVDLTSRLPKGSDVPSTSDVELQVSPPDGVEFVALDESTMPELAQRLEQAESGDLPASL